MSSNKTIDDSNEKKKFIYYS